MKKIICNYAANKIILLLLCISGLKTVHAQKITIEGKLKDSSNSVLAFATTSLYVASKGTVALNTTFSNKDGLYKFKGIDTGRYEIIFSLAGFDEQKISVTVVAGSAIVLPDIILFKKAKALQAVTVSARKQLLEIKDDGISYNTEADPMANSDKLIDLLRKMPMVTVDANDNVEINGQANIKVLLNGRETGMFVRNLKQALKSFPGSVIKRIDIITNPSAKYDAEGVGGIINVITKKKVAGYNGQIGPEINSQTYRGINTSFSLKYKRVGFFITGYAGGNADYKYNNEESIQALAITTFYKRSSTGNARQRGLSGELNFEFNYEADSLNIFNLYGSFDRSRNNNNDSKNFVFIPTSQVGNTERIFNSSVLSKSPGWSGGIDYVRKFKTNSERELSIKLFGSFGNSIQNSSSEETGFSGDRFILNDSKAVDKQYTIQVDYIHPFKQKQKLESGIKLIIRRASSDYESLIKYNAVDNYKQNPQNSDNFSYRQDVYSIYSSYSFSIKNIKFRTGVRLEHTEVDGSFITSQTKVLQSYTNVIPNLLIATKLKNGHAISFNYSMRLSRPYIYNLNPFANNIDSLSVSTGNPSLRPQLFHNTSLQYRFGKGKLFTNFTLGYSYSNSYIIYGYIFNNSTGITTSTFQNNGTMNNVYLSGSLNANPNPQWRINFNSGASYLVIRSRSGLIHQNNGFTGNLGYNSSYKIRPRFTTTTFFNYYFPVLLLQGKRNAYFAYGFGGKYTLVNDKLILTAYVNNPFNKDGVFKRISRFEDLNFIREEIQYARFRAFGLNITWNFGKLNEGGSKKRGVNNTDLL